MNEKEQVKFPNAHPPKVEIKLPKPQRKKGRKNK